MIIPSWQQILNVFGVEMTEKVAHGCDVNVHISDLGFFGEGFITEGGTVVGKTALIEVEERRLKYTEGTLPHGMNADFGPEALNILNAGKHSALLEAEVELDDGSTEYRKGTAFFVSENYLLTAAHNVVPRSGKIIKTSIRYPGLKWIDPTGGTIKCSLIAVMPGYNPTTYKALEDLAILKCSGHDSLDFLHLSTDELPSEAPVHVVGYPGEITEEWLKARHRNLDDYGSSNAAALKLLPQRRLTVTEGKISAMTDGIASYEISTAEGMSGGCLLYNGIHLGHQPNTAVLFRDERVRDFLASNNVLNLVATAVGSFANV